ncbi:MAG: hypothetical protein ABI193_10615, partial [Minicystis sp.]
MKRLFLTSGILSLLYVLPLACGGSGGTGAIRKGAGGGATTSSTTTTGTGDGGSLGFDGGSGSGGNDLPDGDACGSVALTAHVNPGNIVVVFDQSNSMKQPFTDPNGVASGPKWTVAENALVAAVQPIAGLLNLGTIFFP